MPDIYICGIPKQIKEKTYRDTISKLFLKSTSNLRWLKRGDTVLLKPAFNSSDPYPATTDPVILITVSEILQDYGANVIIADQSGIGHVVHSPLGIQSGSSRCSFHMAGIDCLKNTTVVALEETGWKDGFFRHSSSKTKSWKNGFYITDLIRKTDHIINLPRISTHVQAGVTLGFKNFVGWLREDSRLEFHSGGPFSFLMRQRAQSIGISYTVKRQNDFIRKITEIFDAVENKVRLTMFSGTKMQITIGPDRYAVRFGSLTLVPAAIAEPDIGFVFAGSDPVATELVALALLQIEYAKSNFITRVPQKFIHFLNRSIKELGTYPIRENEFICHAKQLGFGSDSVTFSSVLNQNLPLDEIKAIIQ